METIVQKIDKKKDIRQQVKNAAAILRAGGLVAFPTETVYGLGANALDYNASTKIYKAKGRPSDNPLIVHIANKDGLQQLTKGIPEAGIKLMEAFWPGPLTLIFEKSKIVPKETTGGLDTVAIRMPNDKIALALLLESGVYIAAPSANLSGKPSPTKAEHVIEDMNGKINMILDGGMVGIGLESTIVDVTTTVPIILRPGYITRAMLEEVIDTIDIDAAVLNTVLDPTLIPKAPGMKYKHYAPNGNLTIYEGNSQKVIDTINKIAKTKIEENKKVAVIATNETKENYKYGVIKTIGSREDEESIARKLFALLRELDQLQIDYIYSESFQSERLGQAIMNRLLKAAGYQAVHLE